MKKEIKYKTKYIPISIIEDIIEKGGEIIKTETGAGATYSLLLSSKKIIIILPTINLIKEKQQEFKNLTTTNTAVFIYGNSTDKLSSILKKIDLIFLTPEQFNMIKDTDITYLIDNDYRLVIDEVHLVQKMLYRHSISDILERVDIFKKKNNLVTITATPYIHKHKVFKLKDTYRIVKENRSNYNIQVTYNRSVFENEIIKRKEENSLLFSNSYSLLRDVFHYLMSENKNIDFHVGESLRYKLNDCYFKFKKSNTSNFKVGTTASAQGVNILFDKNTKPTIFIHTTPNIDTTFFDIQDIRQIIGRTRTDVDIILFIDERELQGRKIEDTYNKKLLELYQKNNKESQKELLSKTIETSKLFNFFNCDVKILSNNNNNNLSTFIKPTQRQQFSYFQSHFSTTNSKNEIWNNLQHKKDKKAFLENELHLLGFKSGQEYEKTKREIELFILKEKKKKDISKYILYEKYDYKVDIKKIESYIIKISKNINDDLTGSFSLQHILKIIKFYLILKEKQLYHILTNEQPYLYLYTLLNNKKLFIRKGNDYLTLKSATIDIRLKDYRFRENTQQFLKIIDIFQKIANVVYIKEKEIAKYYNGSYFEWRNKNRKDKIFLPGIDNNILYDLLTTPKKNIAKKLEKHKEVSYDDIITIRREIKSSINNIQSLLAMSLKRFDTVRIKNIDYREYSPVTSLSIDLIAQYIPYDFIEIDMSQAYPTFINILLNKTYTNIYETLQTKLSITRTQAKTTYNMAVNIWEKQQEHYKKHILEQIYDSDDVEKLMKYDKKSKLFLELSRLERDEYKKLRKFLLTYDEELIIVRRHDSALVFSNDRNKINEINEKMKSYKSIMKYKKNISFHRVKNNITDKILLQTVFGKIIKKKDINKYIKKTKNKTIEKKPYTIYYINKEKGSRCFLRNKYKISQTSLRRNNKIIKFLGEFELSIEYFLRLTKEKQSYKQKELWHKLHTI